MTEIHIASPEEIHISPVIRRAAAIVTDHVVPPIRYSETSLILGKRTRIAEPIIRDISYTAIFNVEPFSELHREVLVVDHSPRAVPERFLAEIATREIAALEPTEPGAIYGDTFMTEELCAGYRSPLCVIQIGNNAIVGADLDAERTATLYHPSVIDPLTTTLHMQQSLSS